MHNAAAAGAAQWSNSLQVEVISTPLAYSTVLEGVEATMAISTASTPLAMVVLALLLRNIRYAPWNSKSAHQLMQNN